MAFTLNRRLSTLVDSSGQINTGKIPNDYITSDHVADNSITTAMLHTGFTLPTSSLSSIDTDNITEGSTNLFYTDARVDSRLSGGTGVTYSSGTISIGQAVATSDSPTFADLTVTGNLNITGDINSYNVTDLDVTDQTITLGAGQIESNSGGSGIIIDGSNASILWDETNDQFDFNKGVNIDSNTLVVDGTNNRVGILNAAPDVSLDIGSSTDAIHMPVGTTAQRPSSPAAGYFRYNSDDGQFEGYTTEWGAIAGSGGASAMETNNFTGDGSTTAFTLSSTVASEDNLIVFIEGIYQNKGDYVASGTTLTFTTAPVNGRRIVVQHIKSSVAGNSTLYTSLSGDGSTTAFTLSGAPGHENNTQVFMDGVYQQKDSYIVNGTTLTFDAAPANGSSIEVMSFAQTTINQTGSNTVSVAELNLSDGTSGQAIVTDGNGTISFATVGISGIVSSANATAITIDSSERVGIGTGSPSALLDVAYGDYQNSGALRIGADIGTNTSRTNSTRKIGALTVPHYTTSEDDLLVFLQDSDSGGSPLTIGGGSASFNSPSFINFFTSTDGTAYGSERMRISNSNPLTLNKSAGAANSLNNQIALTHTGASTAYHIKTIRAAATDEPAGLAFVENTTERMRIASNGDVQLQGGNQMTNAISWWNSATYELASIENVSHSSYNDSGGLSFKTAGLSNSGMAERMKIDSTGAMTRPNHPCFDVSTTATSLTGTIAFNSVNIDNNSNYSTSNGRFTAPVAGSYMFYTQYIKQNSNTVMRRRFDKNGAAALDNRELRLDTGGPYGYGSMTIIIDLAAGDYVTVNQTVGTSHGGKVYEAFGGHLIG